LKLETRSRARRLRKEERASEHLAALPLPLMLARLLLARTEIPIMNLCDASLSVFCGANKNPIAGSQLPVCSPFCADSCFYKFIIFELSLDPKI